jgi:hypothetical protein
MTLKLMLSDQKRGQTYTKAIWKIYNKIEKSYTIIWLFKKKSKDILKGYIFPRILSDRFCKTILISQLT